MKLERHCQISKVSRIDSQAALFEEVEPAMNQELFLKFKRNEITNFIQINATLVLIAILAVCCRFCHFAWTGYVDFDF